MKENVKNTTKALYTMCICLIVVMGVLFLGNSLTKGTYSAGTVLTKDTKYCSKSGDVVSGSKCCPSGYVVATGGALCCPTGYNKLDSVNLLCSDSKGNTKNAETARTIKTCKAGNILNGNTCTINSASTSCPPGKYYFDQSSQPQNCETCVPGTYCPGGTTSGIPCGSGNYCPEYGLSEPKRCPDDKPLTKTIYSKSINDCYASSTSCENTSQGECAVKYGASNCVMDSNGCWVKKSNGGETITLRFYNGSKLVKSESCFKANGSDSCKDTIYAPGPQTKAGKIFNGWGEKDGCTTGSYTANASFRANTSRNYYACYTDTIDNTPSSTFDKSKCTYSNDTAVVRDDRYKNCKYTNITYNNSASELTEENAKACCIARGYTWVRENFTSSGYGYEYCIKCSSGGDVTPDPIPDPDPEPPTSTPTNPPTSTPSSNVDENPKTGSIAIFMVWVIAIGTLIYSIAYFKQSKFE